MKNDHWNVSAVGIIPPIPNGLRMSSWSRIRRDTLYTGYFIVTSNKVFKVFSLNRFWTNSSLLAKRTSIWVLNVNFFHKYNNEYNNKHLFFIVCTRIVCVQCVVLKSFIWIPLKKIHNENVNIIFINFNQ